jgi:phenylpropionate dioxygenase-like ring-hydroxylating dioxygenase large terminal subunit
MDLSDYIPELDLSRATTLPARWYIDPAFLGFEKEKVFWRTWQPVGRVSQVSKPGDYFACDVSG